MPSKFNPDSKKLLIVIEVLMMILETDDAATKESLWNIAIQFAKEAVGKEDSKYQNMASWKDLTEG